MGLKTYREKIENRLASWLPENAFEPNELCEAMRYSVLSAGKRMRPILSMASAEACGADPDVALDAGCAIELIHCFSLIHDDLPAIDNDELRRGQPTCHVKFGEAVAILAGDALFAKAFEMVSQASTDAAINTALVREIALATGSQGLVAGETLDILSERTPANEATLKTIHLQKTAALFAASCGVGAICANTPGFTQALRSFGTHLGLAFQVVDDILNETGAQEDLGKAAGSDRAMGKMTYPALFGLEASRQIAETEITAALKAIAVLPGNKKSLQEIAEMAILREN